MNWVLGIFLKFSWQHWLWHQYLEDEWNYKPWSSFLSVKTHMGSNRQVFTPPATPTRDKHRTVARYGLENVVLRSLFWKKHKLYYFDSANESNYETSAYLSTWTFHSSLQYLISTNALFGVTCSGRHHLHQLEETYLIISSYTSQ